MMPNVPAPDPLPEFLAHMEEAQRLAAFIRDHVANHMDIDPETVSWANAGGAARLAASLKEIADTFGR